MDRIIRRDDMNQETQRSLLQITTTDSRAIPLSVRSGGEKEIEEGREIGQFDEGAEGAERILESAGMEGE